MSDRGRAAEIPRGRKLYQKMRNLTNSCGRRGSAQAGTSNDDSPDEDLLGTSSTGHSYEELMGESVTCPTCKGLGRVPKADEAKLMALIPYNDKRLRPRRTKMWVSLAVTICATISFLLVFFLIPREIKLMSNHPEVQPYLSNVSSKGVQLALQYHFNVSNNNYVSVYLDNISTVVSYQNDEVAEGSQNETRVNLRETSQDVFVPVNLKFPQSRYKYISIQCQWVDPIASIIWLKFETTAIASYLLHTEQVSLTTMQAVNCSRTLNSTTSPARQSLGQLFGGQS